MTLRRNRYRCAVKRVSHADVSTYQIRLMREQLALLALGSARHRAVRSTSSVGMPQVSPRTVATRVPGLRPVRTSDTSTPADTSRARVASMSATRQLMPQSRSRASSASCVRPVHRLDNEIAAAEEHQPAPIRMRAVERHVEPRAARLTARPRAPDRLSRSPHGPWR